MATVQQIAKRLDAESPYYRNYINEARTGSLPKENTLKYKPNRKIVSAAVSGLVTLGAFILFGPEADPEFASSATLLVMTVIGYLVPLPADEDTV